MRNSIKRWRKSLDYLAGSTLIFGAVVILSATVWLLVSIGGTLSDLIAFIGAILASVTTFGVAYLAIRWQSDASRREGRDLLLPTLTELFSAVTTVTNLNRHAAPDASQVTAYGNALIATHDRLDLAVGLLEHVHELVKPREFALMAALFRLRALLAEHANLRQQEARIVRRGASPAEIRVHLNKLYEPFTEIGAEARNAIEALGATPPVIATAVMPIAITMTASGTAAASPSPNHP